jgi:hypothetical protein
MPVKIAFSGKMRVGKDTAVEFLKSKTTSSDHFSFAQPIYEIMNYAQTVANIEKTKDRQFLQYIGTEWGRGKNENLWVNILLDKAKKSKKDYVFVSDVRFKNEFLSLKKDNWICIKIVKNTSITDNHSSENDLDNIDDQKWDYIIENNDTLQVFYEKLELILSEIVTDI